MAASIQSFGMSEQLSIRRPYAICRRLAWFPGTFSRHAFPKPSDLPPQASSDLSSSALRAEAAHVRWRVRFSRADNGPPAGTRCGGPSKRPQEQRSISYGHTFSRGLKRANIKPSLKNDTWSEQRDSNCQSEVQVSGSECQMVAHSDWYVWYDCSKMGILCAGRGAQTQILIRWIVNAETLIAIFIDHPPLLASCCGNSEA